MSSRHITIVAVAVLAAVGILAVYLFLELGASNDLLADTKSELTNTQTTLAATQSTLQETDVALAAQRAANADLEQTNTTIEGYNAILTANLDDALDAVDEWQVALADKEQELAGANEELAETTATLERTSSSLDELTSDYSLLVTAHDTLNSNYRSLSIRETALRGDYIALKEQAGDLETLRAKVAELEEDISKLEAKRRPLILSVDRTGFACTGSMEPKITCLDEATWLENPRPQEIVVGAVISFYPGCGDEATGDDEDAGGIAHRVMDIKVENGVHHYWPKGDANEEVDGCWVPFDHARAYIIEIHKDARPENAGLRDSVNRASEQLDEALTDLEEAEAELDEREAEYLAIIERYCGLGVEPADCTLPSPQYETAIRAHQWYEYAYAKYERALETLEGMIEYTACWQKAATNAIYLGDGRPTLYVPCLIPIAPPPIIPPFAPS